MGIHGGCRILFQILSPFDLWTYLQFLSCGLPLKRRHQANLPEDAKRIAKKELKPLPQWQRCIWDTKMQVKMKNLMFLPISSLLLEPWSSWLFLDVQLVWLPRRLKSLQAHHPEYTSTHSQDLESRHLMLLGFSGKLPHVYPPHARR